MRMTDISVGAAGFVWLLSGCLPAQSWAVPQGTAMKDSGQIEYATVHEDVLGEMTLAGQEMRVINVFRNGVLERVSGK
jgi:hypothetical protein